MTLYSMTAQYEVGQLTYIDPRKTVGKMSFEAKSEAAAVRKFRKYVASKNFVSEFEDGPPLHIITTITDDKGMMTHKIIPWNKRKISQRTKNDMARLSKMRPMQF